jgi:hypothetical protein
MKPWSEISESGSLDEERQPINHDSVAGLVVGRCWLSQGGICVLTDSGGEAGGLSDYLLLLWAKQK